MIQYLLYQKKTRIILNWTQCVIHLQTTQTQHKFDGIHLRGGCLIYVTITIYTAPRFPMWQTKHLSRVITLLHNVT